MKKYTRRSGNTIMRKHRRWIGVDFDGTLATWDCPWPDDYRSVGVPVPAMVALVKKWIAEGEDVRIFTARMDRYHPKVLGLLTVGDVKGPIQRWCLRHLGRVLPITNKKDYWCKAIYDDRAVQVEKDTGRLVGQ